MKDQNQGQDFNIEDEFEQPSKTQLKKEADDLKKLGIEILDLSAKNRASLPLDSELMEAFELAGKINRKKDGFRRQIQFIGKLLRQRDIAPITLALNKLKASHSEDVEQFHKLEKMRDLLIAQGDEQIQTIIDQFPLADRQKLRHLVRQANKEAKQNKAPAASRELFKYLRELSAQ